MKSFYIVMFSTEYLAHCCQRSEHYVQISVTMCFYISLLLSNSNSLPLHWKHILTIPISCNCRTLVLWLNFCFMVNLSLTTNFSANSDWSTHLRIPNSVLVMVKSMWSLKLLASLWRCSCSTSDLRYIDIQSRHLGLSVLINSRKCFECFKQV